MKKITQHKGPLHMITWCHAERMTCHDDHHLILAEAVRCKQDIVEI